MKHRKPRSDSAESAIKAMINAALPVLDPPDYVRLREQDRPFWEAIIRSRAREEWAETDLVVAAQLARCQADIEMESALLDGEGAIIESQRGSVLNPRFTVVEQHERKQLALMRALSLVVQTRGAHAASTRKLERQARDAHDEVSEDSLLAD